MDEAVCCLRLNVHSAKKRTTGVPAASNTPKEESKSLCGCLTRKLHCREKQMVIIIMLGRDFMSN